MPTEQTSQVKTLLDEDFEEIERRAETHSVPPVNAYQGSRLSGSKIEQDAKDALFGYKPPQFVIMEEKPEHRMILMYKLLGKTNHEIAELVGKGYQWVCQVLRQPWAVVWMETEISKQGRDVLHTMLAQTATDSVLTLIAVRDDPKTKPEAKIQASNALLNRYLGNPTQPISHSGKVNMGSMNDEDLAKIAFSGGIASGAI